MKKRAVFIQANTKQMLGAKIAKYAIERFSSNSIPVHIMRTEEMHEFKAFQGKTYYKSGHLITYTFNDLQSFTLTRFKPPELMHYEGVALVIDPDIFACTDISPLFEELTGERPILACRKNSAWDSSVMVLDCAKLQHWNVSAFMNALSEKEMDYTQYSTLAFEEENVQELDRSWNSLDTLTQDTKFLHTTTRLTQPWKTGLKIDFTRAPLGKKWGLIPREWVHRMLGKYHTRYQPHPDKRIESFFFSLAAEALSAQAITNEDIDAGIRNNELRPDFRTCLAHYTS